MNCLDKAVAAFGRNLLYVASPRDAFKSYLLILKHKDCQHSMYPRDIEVGVRQ